MCNLYSLTKGQAAIRDWFRASRDRTGNLPLFPGIFPDQMAPIVRNGADGGRELVMARWGMPGPPQFRGAAITNVRNASSPHWGGGLRKHNPGIVPAWSFCEYADTKPRKPPMWFALGQDRPLFAFAGLWTPWRGVRGTKSAPVDGEHELFGFLTTEPNAIVAPIHPKAMPAILTTAEEVDLGLEGETPDALKLQRPLPGDFLRIVARGEKEDPPPRFTSRSRTSPSSSTARQSQNGRPAIVTAISSRCHREGWPRASMPKFSGEQWPELQYPSPHRSVGDIQTALR